MTSPTSELPDYAPFPASSLGPALNEQGYSAPGCSNVTPQTGQTISVPIVGTDGSTR